MNFFKKNKHDLWIVIFLLLGGVLIGLYISVIKFPKEIEGSLVKPFTLLIPEMQKWQILTFDKKGKTVVQMPNGDIKIKYFDYDLINISCIEGILKTYTTDTVVTKTITNKHFVKATCYNAKKNQTDKTPFITADGFKINKKHPFKDKVLGMSRDLLKNYGGGPFKYGDTVKVMGTWIYDGLWIIHDTTTDSIQKGNSKVRLTNTIDFLVDSTMYMSNWPKVIISSL
jgi:hypothetical protein